MGSIKRMPASLADQIAAGEVVERPAAVVKELIENAIDAGASHISIVTEQGGQKLISVTDDGRGMDADDLALSFERHATSKIGAASDLAAIKTLGFRGEALPSIASVAKVWARSATGDDEGHEIAVEGSKSRGVKPAPPVKGTTVQVKNLFYNTPARRKFLKAPRTGAEWDEKYFNAPGFPRVFYLRYHGYCAYFPLWALARYRNLRGGDARRPTHGL